MNDEREPSGDDASDEEDGSDEEDLVMKYLDSSSAMRVRMRNFVVGLLASEMANAGKSSQVDYCFKE